MATRPKKNAKRQRRNIKPTSIMPMSLTAGFFLGVGLGALMNSMLVVVVVGVIAGGAFGYYIDRRNGIPYTRRSRPNRP